MLEDLDDFEKYPVGRFYSCVLHVAPRAHSPEVIVWYILLLCHVLEEVYIKNLLLRKIIDILAVNDPRS